MRDRRDGWEGGFDDYHDDRPDAGWDDDPMWRGGSIGGRVVPLRPTQTPGPGGFGRERSGGDGPLGGGGFGADEFDDHRLGGGGYGGGRASSLGDLTTVVLIDGHVVDTVRRPVEGSGYECAALELGRGAPPPAPRVVEVPAQPRHEVERTWLRSRVGGAEELERLDAEPLPDEPLDTSGVPTDLVVRVVAIARQVDGVAEGLFGTELRTACRRLLVRAIVAEPSLLLGSDRDDIAAGAVVHAVAKANNMVGPGCAVTATVLYQWAGLKSSPQDRARRFAHAVSGPEPLFPAGRGLERLFTTRDAWNLGSADLLTSRFRRHLIRLRDLADAERDQAVAG